MLASELPNGRLVDAHSILELRVRPQRLMGKIARFIEDCWDDTEAPAARVAVG
jgi:hypothetical protein